RVGASVLLAHPAAPVESQAGDCLPQAAEVGDPPGYAAAVLLVGLAEPCAEIGFLGGHDRRVEEDRKGEDDQVRARTVEDDQQAQQEEQVPEGERIARVREQYARD